MYTSADRLAPGRPWVRVPDMRITVVRGLNDDDLTMTATLPPAARRAGLMSRIRFLLNFWMVVLGHLKFHLYPKRDLQKIRRVTSFSSCIYTTTRPLCDSTVLHAPPHHTEGL